MNRDFKGIWIPREVWLSKDLTIMEKLFFIEIDSLDNEEYCFASNSYFAEFFDISKGRCTQIIKSLESKNLISIEHERKGKQIVKRLIRVVNKLNNPIKNIKQPYLENAQDNNTVINNTTINKSSVELPLTINKESFNEWLKYKKYKSKAPITKCINFLSVYSFEIQREIIDTSIMNEWKGLFPPKQNFNTHADGKSKAINKAFEILNGNSKQEVCDYEQ